MDGQMGRRELLLATRAYDGANRIKTTACTVRHERVGPSKLEHQMEILDSEYLVGLSWSGRLPSVRSMILRSAIQGSQANGTSAVLVDGVYFERLTVEILKMSSRKQTVDVTKTVANHAIARISK